MRSMLDFFDIYFAAKINDNYLLFIIRVSSNSTIIAWCFLPSAVAFVVCHLCTVFSGKGYDNASLPSVLPKHIKVNRF